MAYYVEIREYDDDTTDDILVKRLGPYTEREAEKAERGVDQRIDPERFYSRTVQTAA